MTPQLRIRDPNGPPHARLAKHTDWRVATLLIHPDNAPSLAVAERNGFERAADVDGRTFWRPRVIDDR